MHEILHTTAQRTPRTTRTHSCSSSGTYSTEAYCTSKGETHLGKLHHLCCGVRSGRHRKRSRRQHSSGGQRSLRKRQSKLSAIAIGRRFAAHSARPKRTTNTQLHLRCVNIKKPGSPDAAAASARQPLPGWPPGALPQASVRPCAGRGVSSSRTSRRREPWRMGSACGRSEFGLTLSSQP